MADKKPTPTEGRIVTFFPNQQASERKFRNEHKESYPAIITQVNEGGNSVDLAIFDVDKTVFQTRVEQKTETETTASVWDWPTRE